MDISMLETSNTPSMQINARILLIRKKDVSTATEAFKIDLHHKD